MQSSQIYLGLRVENEGAMLQAYVGTIGLNGSPRRKDTKGCT